MADDIDWSGGETNPPPPTTKKKLTPEPTDPAYWQRRAEWIAARVPKPENSRPPVIAPARLARLLAAIAGGTSYEGSCAYAGISARSFFRWKARGINKDPGYWHFWQAVQKAEGYAEHGLLTSIRKFPDWKPKAWILERRFKDRWAKYSRLGVEHSGTVNHTHRLSTTVHIEDPQAYLQRLSAMLSRPQLPDDPPIEADFTVAEDEPTD